MKKFLGKLPVMITFVTLAVVMAVAYIAMLVRPVAVGFTYTGKVQDVEVSVKIKNSSEMIMTIDGEETEGRYIVKDREIAILPYKMTDKKFEELKEEALENWEEGADFVEEVSAFKVNYLGEDFTCVGSIVFAAVGGVVLVALLTFGTLSVLYYVKGRKK